VNSVENKSDQNEGDALKGGITGGGAGCGRTSGGGVADAIPCSRARGNVTSVCGDGAGLGLAPHSADRIRRPGSDPKDPADPVGY
jgi:hypothetical protein